jgi:hypothetical protein
LRGLTTLHSQADLSLDSVHALLCSPNLPSLTDLRLWNTSGEGGLPRGPSWSTLEVPRPPYDQAVCEEVVRSGILRRLRRLALLGMHISERGARVLANCPDLRNLQELDLRYNPLSEQGRALLEGLGITVRWQDQANG